MLKRICILLLCVCLICSFFGCTKEEEMTDEEREVFNSRAEALLKNFTGLESDHRIKFLNDKLTVKDEYCYINGSIKNIDFDKIQYVKIVAKFFNRKGEVIDSAYTSISDTLDTDEQKKFEIIYRGTQNDFDDYKLYATDVD